MHVLYRFIEDLKLKAIEIVENAEPNIMIIGIFGTVGYPLFYLIWKYFIPQQYESLELRLFEAIIALPWLFHRFIQKKNEQFFHVYFFASGLLVLPFFFWFMLLKNEWSMVWTMSTMAGLFLLILLLYDWLIISIMIIAGYLLAYAAVMLMDGHVYYTHLEWSYLPLFSFAIVGSIVMNHRRQSSHELKFSLVKSLSGTIAHEMRNPLSSIVYAMDTVQSILPGKPSGNSKKLSSYDISHAALVSIHDVIEESTETVRRGNKIIDSILASLQGGEVDKRSFKRNQARDVIHSAVGTYGYNDPEEKKMISVDTRQNFDFLGDKDLLIYVLFNLLKNAFYYRQKPGFEITITTESTRGENVIRVRDTGPGVPASKREKIFDRFYTSGKPEGNGLGLAFCQRVVQSFGGSLLCDSVENFWTEFIITLPKYESKTAEWIKKQILSNKTILVVDDQLINRALPAKYLAEWNCKVDQAENGMQAIEMAVRKPYDLILMDIEMPVLNGDEAVKLLRSGFNMEQTMLHHYREVPIIGVTALPEEMAVQRTLAVGMNDYIIKPFRRTDLKLLFNKYFFAEKERTTAETSELLNGASILVVDDNATSRKFICMVLESLGSLASMAEDGNQAIEQLEKKDFDLVLMDMEMPVMGGVEATKIIRTGERFKRFTRFPSIPIVALTGNSDHNAIQSLMNAGMNGHLGKPVSKPDLIRTISFWLKKTNAVETPATLMIDALPDRIEVAIPQIKKLEDEPLLNLSVIQSLQEVGGFELLSELFELFLTDANTIIAELDEAREKENLQKADLASHTLKGSAATVGAQKLHLFAQHINDSIRMKRWPEEPAWPDTIHQLLEETRLAFSSYLKREPEMRDSG